VKTHYMHTLNGKPAFYWPGEQICFANRYGKLPPLARSPRQIKRERKLSEEWRRAHGCTPDCFIYGYVRVVTP
jgi:hypothetical protein